jgi:hypothetical protein
MKNNKILIKLIGLMFLIIPLGVKADYFPYRIITTCPTSINPNTEFSCTLYPYTDEPISGLQTDYSTTNGLSCSSIDSNYFTASITSSRILLEPKSSFMINPNVMATYHCKSSISGDATISYSGAKLSIEDNGTQKITPIMDSKTIHINSTDSSLASLSLSNGNFNETFSSSLTNYTATINAANTVINLTKSNSGATVSNYGYENLNYGSNTFNIVVTAEAGNKTTYTIVIYRPDNRSTNNNLSNITLSSGNINFNTNTTSYDVTVNGDVSNVKVNGTVEDSKASLNYSPSQSVDLNYGETKTINILVSAENGSQKNYAINITREDNRSKNNYLKSLSIEGYDIGFNKDKTSYTLEVENTVSSIKINGETEDSTAVIKGLGAFNLNVGSNKLIVNVIAQNGDKKTYIITIIKKDAQGNSVSLSNNNYLSSLTMEGTNILFNKETLNYVIGVKNNVTDAKINYSPEDEKSTVTIEGNTILIVGINKIIIKVTAEDSSQREYVLLINREENNVINTNDVNEINNKLNNTNDLLVVSSKDNINLDSNILNNLSNTNKNIELDKINDTNGLLYSLLIKGSNVNGKDSFSNLINLSNNDENVNKLVNSNYLYLSNENGFIDGTILNLLVNDYYNDNDVLYLYAIEDGKLVNLNQSVNVLDGYVKLNLTNDSKYVLLNDNLDNLNKNELIGNEVKNNKTLVIILFIIALGIIGAIIYVIIKRRKKEN